ncbi:hypothetical protein [Streptomyces sp. GESEQ-35]|uniref:hypothetical protein n=1 Tax=Streptomyces sp. GESEQ-35 TaxID=2812657 RepID=UPI001B331006|nr:hypothetical protein [Streptomyces sp. GESEQ-35]
MLRSTRATWTHGRRCAAIGASAAVVCLGGVLAACGAGGGDGYVATGSAPQASGTAVQPTGEVSLVPLDVGSSAPPSMPADSQDADGGSSTPSSRERPTPDSPTPSTETENRGATSPRTPSTSPPSSSGGTRTTAPAALAWSEPEREAADERWCEKVTVGFHNSGGTAVRSGTVTFGTHIIGALGIDWGTVESAEELPAPVRAGARKEKSWTVCVDAWRVPLGMHIETRDVSVQWK